MAEFMKQQLHQNGGDERRAIQIYVVAEFWGDSKLLHPLQEKKNLEGLVPGKCNVGPDLKKIVY